MSVTETASPGTIVRSRHVYRFRVFAAGISSAIASLAFIAAYYALFFFVPSTIGDGNSGLPHLPWLGKFDLAQFFGTLIVPPYPTNTTWLVGIVVLFGTLASLGIAYCLTLAWAMTSSSARLGAALGLSTFFLLGFTIWTANGFQPAVMRAALPDVGFFLLGWSGWATLALAASCLVYGITVGAMYAAFARFAGRFNL